MMSHDGTVAARQGRRILQFPEGLNPHEREVETMLHGLDVAPETAAMMMRMAYALTERGYSLDELALICNKLRKRSERPRTRRSGR